MFKFAGAVIDFYDDPDFFSDPEAQKLVGSAVIPMDKTASIPDDGFSVRIKTAAGIHRKFPIYNEAVTALSGMYFDKASENLPEEIRKTAGFFLKDAYERFGLSVPASLSGIFEEPESRTVAYSPEPDPISVTRESFMKLAEHSYMDSFRSMHVLEKVSKAAHISNAADSMNHPVGEQAVWDYVPKRSFGPLLKEALFQRETLVSQDPMLKEAFSELMGDFPRFTPDVAPFILYEFDKMAGFDVRYGLGGIVDPFMAAWGGCLLPSKQASVEEDMIGYKLSTLARRDDIMDQVFSEDFISKFKRDPKGVYNDAAPEQKRIIKSLMEKIPTGEEESLKSKNTVKGRGKSSPKTPVSSVGNEGL
jgi:hypothetical protein